MVFDALLKMLVDLLPRRRAVGALGFVGHPCIASNARPSRGGLGMGGKAPHSALLALQAMQPPVRPVRPDQGQGSQRAPSLLKRSIRSTEGKGAMPHKCLIGIFEEIGKP